MQHLAQRIVGPCEPYRLEGLLEEVRIFLLRERTVKNYLLRERTAEQFARVADALLAKQGRAHAPRINGGSDALTVLRAVAEIAEKHDGSCRWWGFLVGSQAPAGVDEIAALLHVVLDREGSWLRLTAYVAAREMGAAGKSISARAAKDPDAAVRARFVAIKAAHRMRRRTKAGA